MRDHAALFAPDYRGEAFGVWMAPGQSRRITYSKAVMEEIRLEGLDRHMAIPRGGLEIGGVFFGKRENDGVCILAHRPLQLEYLNGPGFSLSANDEAALAKLLEDAPQELGLADLEPVGWYHSHTRSDVFLSAEDLELYNRFFPEPWQVVFVLRPLKLKPTRAGFFFREPSGFVHASASYREFAMEDEASPVTTLELARIEAEPEIQVRAVPAPRRTYSPIAHRVPGRRRRFLLAAMVSAGAVCLLALALWRPAPAPLEAAAPVPLRLKLANFGNQVTIEWNHNASSLARARQGTLEIAESGVNPPISLPLDRDALQAGNATYVLRGGGNVRVRLRVDQSQAVSQLIAAAPILEKPTERSRASEPEPPVVKPMPAARPAPEFRPPPARVSAGLVAQSDFQPAPQIATPLLQQMPGPPNRQVRLPSPPPASVVSAPPVPAAPVSGRAIWTGSVRKGALITIAGEQASAGSLNASLPRRPLRVSAYPAELGADGMVVYTAGGGERSERPSAANGWNLTTYRSDARKRSALSVVQTPSEANGWKLILRANTAVPMVVIDWQEEAAR